MHTENVQEALRNISTIQRIMRQVSSNENRTGLASPDTAISLQITALVLSVGLLIQDLGLNPFSGGDITPSYVLSLSAHNTFLRVAVIGAVAVFLGLLSLGLYTILWTSAKSQREEISSYIARNFRSLSAISFLSDLSVKFCATAMAIATGYPALVSPLMLLCTADYLFQGRFFSLPFRTSLVLGVLAIGIGALQVYHGNGNLWVAVAVFSSITALSVSSLIVSKKAYARAAATEGESHE